MVRRKVLVIFGFVFVLVVINFWSVVTILRDLNNESVVKGAQTKVILPIPTTVPSVTPIPTVIPSPTTKPLLKKTFSQTMTPTPNSRQKGGWYWNAQLGKAQVWLGTDGEGKDIWTDSFPEPTATPTPYTYSGHAGAVSGNNTISVGTINSHKAAVTKEHKTIKVEKKP